MVGKSGFRHLGKNWNRAWPKTSDVIKVVHINAIALRGQSKNRTGYLETTYVGWTNKARLTVCSKAIVKRESVQS